MLSDENRLQKDGRRQISPGNKEQKFSHASGNKRNMFWININKFKGVK